MSELQKKLKHYRLSPAEFERMEKLLGRPPQDVEWPLFSALWSEHCSYKSSKIHLKKFAKTMNSSVVNASGENAGVVDLGEGERIAFKMESHNHPSFIEPYQGAATGVGGILRDIFTMGAKPIASANYLCFGDLGAERMPQLVDGVVKGISGYGNCVGVPTVTGQTNFDLSYNKNILVNAMAVGLFRPGEKIALSAAKGAGNFVVYVGAKTGKDGVHGAAMASESFEKDSESKKPNVQIGDPYFEKLLIESCYEVLQKDLVVAIQDMGAAGLTSSSFEMASKGQVGMNLDLAKVPLRDSSMTPEEILLSESQERMLLVCVPEKFSEIQSVFKRWGLDAVRVGEIVTERKINLYWNSELLTSIDPDLLVENAPVYERPFKSWTATNKVEGKEDLAEIEPSLEVHLKHNLSLSAYGSREAIYRQYDQRVGAKTAHGADYDVALLQLPDSKRGLALAVGCRPQVMKMDARLGALDAIYYPALQMALKGAKALAVTDCLNFGNPEKLPIMSEFAASVDALVEAAIHLETPVVSGNVSFYNETLGENITSTPATGLIGLRESVENIPEDSFSAKDQRVFVVTFAGAQSYQQKFYGDIDGKEFASFLESLREIVKDKNIKATQAVGELGLAFTLAKMSLSGFTFWTDQAREKEFWMYQNFYQAVFVVEDDKKFEKQIKNLVQSFTTRVSVEDIGFTRDSDFEIEGLVRMSQEYLKTLYRGVLHQAIPFGVQI